MRGHNRKAKHDNNQALAEEEEAAQARADLSNNLLQTKGALQKKSEQASLQQQAYRAEKKHLLTEKAHAQRGQQNAEREVSQKTFVSDVSMIMMIMMIMMMRISLFTTLTILLSCPDAFHARHRHRFTRRSGTKQGRTNREQPQGKQKWKGERQGRR